MEGAKLAIHDPKVQPSQINKDLGNHILFQKEKKKDLKNDESNLMFFTDIYQAAKKAHAIIIITEWADYKKIDWNIISKNMSKPSWVFDTRGILEKDKINKYGINFWQLGDGSGRN